MIMKKENILLIGGGGHCSSVIDVIEQQNKYAIAGIIDVKEKIGQSNMGYKVIGCDNDIPCLIQDYKNFLITLGFIRTPEKRINLFNLLIGFKVSFPVIISPIAYVSKHAIVGSGTVVMHFAQINANSRIGYNCIINSKALIEHDACIGNNCHISTGAIINGGVKVGEECFIGSGVVTKQYVDVPNHSFLKANTVFKGK